MVKSRRNIEVESVSGDMVEYSAYRFLVEDMKSVKAIDRKSNIMDTGKKEVKIFISYAHEDEKIKDELVGTHLKAIQNHYFDSLVAWTDAEIKPGSNWDNKIKKEIEGADIIIFLITPNFLASDYIMNTEMKNALERFKEKKQIIVPVYIEGVAKALLPFKDKQYLPSGTPLKKWRDKNDAWIKIQESIIKLIDDVKAGNTAEYFA